MKRHARDWTLEEYDDWCAATDRAKAVAEAADEEGGPGLTLVPRTERNEVWPTDLLPPAAAEPSSAGEPGAEGPADPPVAAMPFDGVELEDSRKRLAGWSASSSAPSPRPAPSISPAPPHGSPRARPTSCGPARPPSPRPGTRRTSSPSGVCPPSPSIARSTAAPSRSGRRANSWRRSACRATGC